MKKDKFVPMKIYFDHDSFELAVKQAEEKINILTEAFNWCTEYIDVSKMDRHEFINDMVTEFTNQLELQKSDIVNTKLSVDKLMFLLDINVAELNILKQKYDRINSKVEVVNSDWKCEVSKESYIRYTKNELENEKLICGNNLIKALELVSKYRKVYPHNVQMATSNFVTYDMRRKKYEVNMLDI